MSESLPTPDGFLDPDPCALSTGPAEENFDEKYNKRLEFPLSLISAVLIHVFLAALLVVFLVYVIGNGRDLPNVPVQLVELPGLDDAGAGAPGAGRNNDPFFNDEPESLRPPSPESFHLPNLPDVAEPPDPKNPESSDPPGNTPAKSQPGGKPGAGGGTGQGNEPSRDKGPGGAGADSTQARNLRWVLRFKVSSGRDYVDQLKMMGAEVAVRGPGSDEVTLVPDLDKPTEHRVATQADLKRLGTKIKFSDSRPEAVNGVTRVLGLETLSPKEFWAFFPADLEKELADKEKSYRNRHPEDIEETIFLVTIREGKIRIVVDEQKTKH
jgi:hypothetical protein